MKLVATEGEEDRELLFLIISLITLWFSNYAFVFIILKITFSEMLPAI